MTSLRHPVLLLLAAGIFVASLAPAGFAHCDALDGPVIQDARRAFELGEVDPVLKWVPADDEQTIRDAFQKTVAVRGESDAARDLADRWFFETLVRVHREGEGAHFTGLKPAGSVDNPALLKADKALETGEIDEFASLIADHTEDAVKESFAKVQQLAATKDESPEAGREWVMAYVHYIHLVRDVADVVHGRSAGHGAATAGSTRAAAGGAGCGG